MVPVKKKTKAAVLAATLAAFALVLGAALLLSRGAGSDRVQSGEHPLRISEYMSANTAYPNADGRVCDWIEIHNVSDKPFNVSGYRLSDDVTRSRYAFPVGTVIPADGYIVVYCDPERSGGMYAPFSLRRLGGETLLLMNSANTVLDEIETLRCRKNTSIVRSDDGSFTVSAAPTPGYANTDEGYAAFAAERGFGDVSVQITEVCLRGETLYRDADGDASDWIELYNAGTEGVSLGGWYLSDDPDEPARWRIPDIMLAPGEYRVIFASGKNRTQGELHTDFALSAGESVVLTTPIGSTADRVELTLTEPDASLALLGGEWRECASPTPGKANG